MLARVDGVALTLEDAGQREQCVDVVRIGGADVAQTALGLGLLRVFQHCGKRAQGRVIVHPLKLAA